jgi:hypothetical protein
MGLDLWFQEDVARILAATHETMTAVVDAVPAPDSEAAHAYQRGFAAALHAVAVAFGLSPSGLTSQRKRAQPAARPLSLVEGRPKGQSLEEMVDG